MKRTGILLYRENLNKGKIYTRRIYNTDRKIITEGREEWMMRFQMIEIDHIYRKEIYCANSAADPTSFIFSTKTAPPPIFDFRNTKIFVGGFTISFFFSQYPDLGPLKKPCKTHTFYSWLVLTYCKWYKTIMRKFQEWECR